MYDALSKKLKLAATASLLCFGTAHATDLVVEVNNVAMNSGRVLVSLFNKADGFPRKGYWQGEAVAPTSKTVSVTFRDIPEGTYAVTAFHDVDGNGKLNTNGLGIPIEPLAFSNDAAPALDGPPKYSDASFKVSSPKMKISLTLK